MHFSKSIPKKLIQSIDGLIQQFSLRRVLIAFSGGPDSQALLYALSYWRKFLEIGVAHVDHNWREESTEEAKVLQKQVEALGLPFYLKTLDPEKLTGNIEQTCRNERYAFFKEICDLESYQAVFLGHHRDDLAETILKRVLEGASLLAMSGMQKQSTLNGTLILRPMLDIPKKELIQMLQEQNIPSIEDKTNLDPRFLRGKFRKTILPGLNQDFGKSVTEPLVRLGQECVELTEFMKSRFKDHLNQKDMLDFSSIDTKFEIKWIVGTWLKAQGLNPSYAVLDDMAEKKSDTRYLVDGKTIEVDRGRLFIGDLPRLSGCYLLNDGSGKWNGWNIQIEPLHLDDEEVVGWKDCWNGKIQFHLPDGDFSFISYLDLPNQEKKMLQKQWTNEKIPAFFRHFVPVVSNGDCLIREFLLSSKRSASSMGNCTKKVILYLE
jgi:tRNA(Ile)-lysidine synthase